MIPRITYTGIVFLRRYIYQVYFLYAYHRWGVYIAINGSIFNPVRKPRLIGAVAAFTSVFCP